MTIDVSCNNCNGLENLSFSSGTRYSSGKIFRYVLIQCKNCGDEREFDLSNRKVYGISPVESLERVINRELEKYRYRDPR
jgi:RNase P subunit RPR2